MFLLFEFFSFRHQEPWTPLGGQRSPDLVWKIYKRPLLPRAIGLATWDNNVWRGCMLDRRCTAGITVNDIVPKCPVCLSWGSDGTNDSTYRKGPSGPTGNWVSVRSTARDGRAVAACVSGGAIGLQVIGSPYR